VGLLFEEPKHRLHRSPCSPAIPVPDPELPNTNKSSWKETSPSPAIRPAWLPISIQRVQVQAGYMLEGSTPPGNRWDGIAHFGACHLRRTELNLTRNPYGPQWEGDSLLQSNLLGFWKFDPSYR